MNDSTTKDINVTDTKKGYPMASLITIVLIIAKVWGGADISWFFCFAPILFCLGIALLIIVISLIAVIVTYIIYQ